MKTNQGRIVSLENELKNLKTALNEEKWEIVEKLIGEMRKGDQAQDERFDREMSRTEKRLKEKIEDVEKSGQATHKELRGFEKYIAATALVLAGGLISYLSRLLMATLQGG